MVFGHRPTPRIIAGAIPILFSLYLGPVAGGTGRALGATQRKAVRKRTDPAKPALAKAGGEPLPVDSFHTLLGDLATLTRNVVRLGRDRLTAILATPTRTQHRALDLLGVTPTP